MKKVESYIKENGDVRDLDEHFFKNAKRGRPLLPDTEKKQQVTILLDPDIIKHFKAGNPKGWQTRINEALRKVAGLN